MGERILVVDDDPIQRRLLEEAVRRFGHTAVVVESGVEALRVLTSPDGRTIALVILDLVMPDLDGMGVLLEMRKAEIAVPVIVQTSHGGIDTVVSAMRAGAFDFVVKPLSPERLQVSLINALKFASLEEEVVRSRRAATGTLTFDDLATASPAMDRVIRLGRRAAASQIPILIEGESGVGKELIARAIQGSSDRRAKPFVTVNCGAIAENLVESILFGHEKGAFTGAVDRHVGKFQEAHGGTLFLDEVGELPPEIQVKLLRAIQEGEIEPVGSRKPVKVDFRLISATNRSLLDLTKEGRFREDLYYRLNVFPVWVPPLRDRKEDIPELVRTFVARFTAEEGRRRLLGVAPEAMALLERYDSGGCSASRRRRWRCSSATTGRATSASWRTRCSAPWCSPMGPISGSRSSRRSPPRSARCRSKRATGCWSPRRSGWRKRRTAPPRNRGWWPAVRRRCRCPAGRRARRGSPAVRVRRPSDSCDLWTRPDTSATSPRSRRR